MKLPVLAVALASAILAAPATGAAQTILTPFAGVTTAKDSPGERFTGGASVLFMGNVAGLELDMGITPDFFANHSSGLFNDSNVTTLSANLLFGVGVGPVRPYVTGGAGLLRTSIDSASNLFDDLSETDFGVNAGGGIILMVSEHVGVRGDARYFRSLQNIDVGDLSVSLGNFDFWRVYGGLSFAF